MSSVEEQVEDWAKNHLNDIKYYTKTEKINDEIENALKMAPSKRGGSGKNYPDIKLFIQTKEMKKIPVMIEVKGTKGSLIKTNSENEIDNYTKEGNPNYTNINKYAVNGAIHYANAIIKYTESYKDVIAIGINGYKDIETLKIELKVYYISTNNYMIPKEVEEYSDLSFLQDENIDEFIEKINQLDLTAEEKEEKAKEYENDIEVKLKELNQKMQDDLKISVGSRVELVAGMIMAGLGVEKKIEPLAISDLKSENSDRANDGLVIINKIDSFLYERNLPEEKKKMIINDLSRVFIYSDLWKPINGESKLKTVYAFVKNNIMPIFTSAKHLDFTGKLFNVLNTWVDIPDSDRNDVVLTPRYVTELMAKLAKVDMNSYVWDYAAGSAGFLISSMKLMINDAEKRIKSPEKLSIKKKEIKYMQLLGIEKRADIYMLAVLNMILMGDGSSNIIHKDSLKEYDGNYEQGKLSGKPFPANVFLLNPPYSTDGKGFIFVEKALSRMKQGRAAILIQENAGSGNGLPYTKRILENNTLVASIHMSDIFKGKAGVQTAIYVFEIGKKHNEKEIVKFIDFSNDGYTRLNRKKSSQDANLQNTDHAIERYNEIVNLVLYGKKYLKYFTEKEYIEDCISLNGDDWTFIQHKNIDIMPKEEDFIKAIRSYIGWKINSILNGETIEKIELPKDKLSEKEKEILNKYKTGKIKYDKFKIEKLFDSENGNIDIQQKHINGKGIYVVSSGEQNNGIIGKTDLEAKVFKKNSITIDMFGNVNLRDFEYKMVTHARVFNISYKERDLTSEEGIYFSACLKYFNEVFSYGDMASWNKSKNKDIVLPIKEPGIIDFEFINSFIQILEKIVLKNTFNLD